MKWDPRTHQVVVVGAGVMGAGIAQVFASHGHEVLLNDVDEVRIKQGIAGIAKRLDREVEKGRLTSIERNRILKHIDPRPHFKDLDVALAIEAATEDFATKADLFHRLDVNTAPDTILATNTSSISITTPGGGTSVSGTKKSGISLAVGSTRYLSKSRSPSA